VTISRSDSGYTFVNFNFVIDGDEDYEPEKLTSDQLKEKRMKTCAAIGAKNQSVIDQLNNKKLRDVND